MDFNILLRFLFAHFLCDFLLQPKWLVDQKRSQDEDTRLQANIGHSLLHAAATYLIAGAWTAWYIPLIVLVSHFATDFWYKARKEGVRPFVIDQLLHIVVLVLLWLLCTGQFGTLYTKISELAGGDKIWVILLAYMLVLNPTSILIAGITGKWGRELIIFENKGLKDAGKWIGYIERLLIITFIFTGNFEAIGFLLAAKTIFRYGDLKELREVKMTEYVMIGTLLSFSVAIVIGILLKTYLL